MRTKELKLSHKNLYTLTDGTTWTLDELASISGIHIRTMYHRLYKGVRDYDTLIIKPRAKENGESVYTLTDGSTWTASSLAEYLGCKRATAQSRFYSKYPLDPERVLKPVRCSSPFNEEWKKDKTLKQEVEARMYEDSTGFWKLFNKTLYTGLSTR